MDAKRNLLTGTFKNIIKLIKIKPYQLDEIAPSNKHEHHIAPQLFGFNHGTLV
tara:strand:- start:136 stop:294 length:159 start_codon:yes stop_codon:yes gene_type:complete